MAFERVSRLDEIPEEGALIVHVGREEISLCKVRGQLYAVSNVCTHDGGSLGEGELSGHVIECPRHGSQFDIRTGAVLSSPAVEPLPVFPVRIVGGSVEVDTAS